MNFVTKATLIHNIDNRCHIYKDWKDIVVVQLVYMQLCFMWVVNSFPKGGNKSIHVHIHTFVCMHAHTHTHKSYGQKNSKRSLSCTWFHKSNSYIIFVVPLIPLSLDDWCSQGASAADKDNTTYRDVCKSARQNLKDTFTTDGTLQPPGPGSVIPPLSNRTVMHYSFDMAQQVIKMSNNNITIPVFIGALSIRPLSTRSCLFFNS